MKGLGSFLLVQPATWADPSGHILWFTAVVGAVVGAVAGTAGYVASAVATGQDLDLGQGLLAAGAGAVTGGVCGATLGAACVAAGAVTSVVQYELSPGDSTLEGYAINATLGGALALVGAGPLVKPHPVTFTRELWPGSILSMTLANHDVSTRFLIASATRSSIAASGQNLVGGFLLGGDADRKSQVLQPDR